MLRRHGERVAQFLADRVADVAGKGDHDGVATCVAIADRVDRLRVDAGPDGLRH
ncbi:DUF6961 family protein [Sphingomonas sp. ASY06-1R]|uniref:DUF6961 family protein n=1 Tax=Sphingomonas sp. ASY06-1R TaxID=3445771 RepID=UPI003FA2F2A1